MIWLKLFWVVLVWVLNTIPLNPLWKPIEPPKQINTVKKEAQEIKESYKLFKQTINYKK